MNASRTTTGHRLTVLFVLTVLISIVPVAAAWAAPADLDSGFDSDGRVLTEINPGHDSGEAVAVQPDDKILVAGFTTDPATFQYDSVLVRYDQHGNLDPTFGTSGKVVVDFSGAGHSDQILDIALAPNGDIVAVGATDLNLSTQRMIVARFGPTGVLDTGFGSGGIAETGVIGQAIGRAVALPGDGKIVVASDVNDAVVAARFTSTGQLDSSFHADGWATADFGSYADDQAEDVAIDAAGNIVVVGHFYGNATGSDDMTVARFGTDGLLDPTFDGDGKKVLDFSTYADGAIWDYSHDHAYGVVLQADGKILLAGDVDAADPTSELDAGRDFAAVRLSDSGALDTSFAGDGLARVAFSTSAGDQDTAYDVVIQRNDKILLTGLANVGTEHFGLARLMLDGSPDETFGTGGKVATNFEGDSGPTGGAANAVVLQDDGKIVAAGSGNTNHGSVAVARYLGDPVAVTASLSVTKTGAGTGTVSSDPIGIDCGDDCTEEYTEGSSVVLNAAAGDNSRFTGWSGDCSGTSASCTTTMDAARSVTANFEPVERALTVTKTADGSGVVSGGDGGIDCGTDCSHSYMHGTVVELTATPASGSTFGGWEGCSSVTDATCSVGMTADRSVTATFTADPPLSPSPSPSPTEEPPPPSPSPSPSPTEEPPPPSPSPSPSPTEEPLTMTVADVSVTETESHQVVTFTASLSRSAQEDIGADYETSPGTAAAPSDFASEQGSILFGAGQTTAQIDVEVQGDNLAEMTETFRLELSNGRGATISDATGEATIWDDDPSCPGYAISSVPQIVGTERDDRLEGSHGPEIVCGLGGRDVIDGFGGDDILMGGDASDVLRGGDGKDIIRGADGVDNIKGGGGADQIFGGPGGDGLYGDSGADAIAGGEGDDLIAGEFDDDHLEGGAGDDSISGGYGTDTILGGTADDGLDGGGDNDDISGEGGRDSLTGGGGDDRMSGGDGSDTFDDRDLRLAPDRNPGNYEDGADHIQGGDGPDRIWSGSGNDLILGGGGNDFIDASAGDDSVSGHAGHDDIHGGGQADLVYAGEGDDYLVGHYGSDKLYGQTGNDVLKGWRFGDQESQFDRKAHDVLGGGSGSDWCQDGETVNECRVPGWFDKTWVVMANPHGDAG